MDRLSHPYLSNHPTQGFTSRDESGDIVIGSNKKIKNKKLLIIGAILSGVIILLIIVVSLLVANQNKRALGLIDRDFAAVENIENVFNGAFYGTLTTELFFSDETYEMFNRDLPRLLEFARNFTKINPSKVSIEIREPVNKIQEGLELRRQALEPTLQLYNNLYAILSGSKSGILQEYANSENDNLRFLAGRFADIDANSFWQSTTIPQVILSTYNDNLYYYRPLIPEMQNIVNELRK